MSDLVKVYFVVSTRNHRTGKISYSLGDNFSQVPKGSRTVFGTGHYDRDVVMGRLRKCRSGEWFPEQHQARKAREREDTRMRKRLHAQYLKGLKHTKSQ